MGYQVKIRKQGFPTVSRQFDRFADAERFALDTLQAMTARTFTDRREAERTTLADALDRYKREVTPHKKSAYGEGCLIERLKKLRLAEYSIATIQGADIAGYRDARAVEGASANTIRIELALLSHLYTVAASDWGMPLANPVRQARKPKLPRGRDRRLDRQRDDNGLTEEDRLLAACKASKSRWLEPIVRLALETGMRRGEILGLRWEHIDLSHGTAHLPDTKNGDSRSVPLSPAARRALLAVHRTRQAKCRNRIKPAQRVAVVLTVQANDRRKIKRRARRGPLFPIGDSGFVHTFQRAAENAGLVDFHFHDLRHEATSRLFERGLDVMEVASITGHKTLSMLKRYTHLRARDLAKKLATLPAPTLTASPAKQRPTTAGAGNVVPLKKAG
ncbi:MAG: site-specific integrase [Magnetospirillum sp.]|nr:site-specific integrase [Magnetospirillum sp.]